MSCRKMLLMAAMTIGVMGASGRSAFAGTTGFETVTVDRGAGDATFTIDFPHVPSFLTKAMNGKPADSFEVEIAANPGKGNPLANLTSIVRGDEIAVAHGLRIRNGSPADFSDPNSGGWGTVRGTVPFTVSDTKVSFTAPLTTLGAPGGKFAYRIFTEEGGAIKNVTQSQSVPLPPALNAGLLMLMLGMGFVGLRGFLRRNTVEAR